MTLHHWVIFFGLIFIGRMIFPCDPQSLLDTVRMVTAGTLYIVGGVLLGRRGR